MTKQTPEEVISAGMRALAARKWDKMTKRKRREHIRKMNDARLAKARV